MNSPGIVLIGFMGSGKTAVGRCLAHRIEADFWDTDTEIERAAGRTIAQIFAEEGEMRFRALETRVLQDMVGSSARDPRRSVIATGGGIPLSTENQVLLKKLGTIVWLTAPAQQILQRVGPELEVRPLLAGYAADPLRRIADLLADRQPRYQAVSDVIWDTSRFSSPDDTAFALAEYLCQTVARP